MAGNPLLQMLGGLMGGGNSGSAQGGGGNAVLLQAIGAAMRGESPQKFMKRLAKSNPQLNGLNLDDLQGTSEALCKQRGVNKDDITKQIGDMIDSSRN